MRNKVWIVAVCLFPLTAMADWSDILSDIYNLESQTLPNLSDIKSLGQSTLNELQGDLKGNYGYGNLDNSEQDVNQRQWSNDNWTDVLNMNSNGNASAFAQAQKSYANLYPVNNANQIGDTLKNGGLTRTYYQQNSEISRAALAASSYNYNLINQHIQTIHDILTKLEDQPSEKAAIDLNTRLAAETSFIQLEMLRMQNIQTQLAATQSQGEVDGMSNEANFMQWNPQ